MNALIASLIWLILAIIDIFFWVVIGSAVMSWLIAFNVINIRNPYVSLIWDTLMRLTEPMLAPIRRILPNMGGIDISPVILLLGLQFLRHFIVNLTSGL